MKISMALRSGLAHSTYFFGWISWKIRKVRDGSLILAYHRVLPKSDAAEGVQPGMYIDSRRFGAHLKFLQRHFSLRPLAALTDETPRSPRSQVKPDCFLTFDDGWRDFYTYAFPVLKAFRVPATVFLPTDYIGKEQWFWTDRLAHFLSKRDERVGLNRPSENITVNALENLNGSQEARLESAIEILKPLRAEEIENSLKEIAARWRVSSGPSGRTFLTWEEVREMADSGLVAYGSHGASHRILTTLSETEIEKELLGSRDKLVSEGAVTGDFIPFCYPNGNYNDKILQLARRAGYALAVTTDNGWVLGDSDRFRLKRICLHHDISSTDALLGYRIAQGL